MKSLISKNIAFSIILFEYFELLLYCFVSLGFIILSLSEKDPIKFGLKKLLPSNIDGIIDVILTFLLIFSF